MVKIVRVGVTFPPDLLKELDETTEKMGYKSRSKAIQDAVRSFITEYQRLSEQKGTKVGVLVIMYDHKAAGLEEALTDTQHKHSNVICSSTHVHLSERDCLQAIAVKGDAEDIRKMAQDLAAKRGVTQLKSIIVSSTG